VPDEDVAPLDDLAVAGVDRCVPEEVGRLGRVGTLVVRGLTVAEERLGGVEGIAVSEAGRECAGVERDDWAADGRRRNAG
jgi:hypothetical protein